MAFLFMYRTKFVRYLDFSKIENLYQKLVTINLKDLDDREFLYVTGALDAMMAVIGVENKLYRILGLAEEEVSAKDLEFLLSDIPSELLKEYDQDNKSE